MNLYLRGLDGNIKQGDSILNDQHKGLEADYILTNPPFNMSEWGKDSIADDDPRFKYGMPPSNNANYAFIQHMIHHLGDSGMAATVMANGAMSAQNKQGDIRKNIIKDDLLDAVIALPGDLFYTTSIPACIFILSKGKESDQYRGRSGETLFIDARDMYQEINSTLNKLSQDHISEVVQTVRSYRGEDEAGDYSDTKGFCAVANVDEIEEHNWVITPGRYVGIPENNEGDDEPFDQKIERLTDTLSDQFDQSDVLKEEIRTNLKEIGYDAN